MAYSGMFFVAGGVIYLYRKSLQEIANKYNGLLFIGIVFTVVVYFCLDMAELIMLLLGSLILIYALSSQKGKMNLLANSVTEKLSNISMEIYLSHMVIFRLIEKLGLTRIVVSELWSFIIASILTLIGTVVFALIVKMLISKMDRLIKRYCGRKYSETRL